MKKYIPLVLFVLMFISCATQLTFNVEHPPLVDLRDVKTITVIPFEWDSTDEYAHLAKYVTAALVYDVSRGNITYAHPAEMQHISPLEYWRYADVYITGKITSINVSEHTISKEDNTRLIITRSVVVDIEYTYVRAKNNEILGHFQKSASHTSTTERFVFSSGNTVTRNRNLDTRDRHFDARNRHHNSRRRENIYIWLHDSWTVSIAATAIRKFSNTMNQEIGTWTTTEKRTLKGNSGNLAQAKRMIRHRYFGGAFEIYSNMYKETGNINAGYNLALLLQFDDQYEQALELLEKIQKNILESGRRVPAFLIRETVRVSNYMEGFEILENYRK
ncbi:MAG: hypothetical protein FWD26_01235 [Treponema sp.]|nr:hypothetical protein [Treponema sp.]